jgi:uncharacterized protein YyaL (SSP411 family)
MSIQWSPWGPAALARAAAEARSLFVLVSNKFSHATRALDAELADDAALERILTTRYVPVRADCDERPDVDARLQALAGRAAAPSWPLGAILGRDGEPLWAGTHLTRAALLATLSAPPTSPLPELAPVSGNVDDALAAMRAACDRGQGGFELAPKRPRPPLLDLMLAVDAPLAHRTLDALVAGGIHDQLGGGFHHYSTDERWVVPHFEKRAGDQAALLTTLARASATTGELRYARAARQIVAYLECRLAADNGGYYASEAADVGAYDDGSYYTWTVDEARAVLDADELAVAQPYFDLYGRGELHSDPTRNVLFIAAGPEDVARELKRDLADVQALLSRARSKLLAARDERTPPPVDARVYSGVSARVARAYLEADGVLHERHGALLTLQRLYGARAKDGSIPHALDGKSDDGLRWLGDHTEVGLAALRAFDVTGDRTHLEHAMAMGEHLVENYWHPDGGFSDVPGGTTRPIHDALDNAGPSANAVAAALLWGLSAHASAPFLRERAAQLMEALLPLACGIGLDGAGLIYLHVVGGVGQ